MSITIWLLFLECDAEIKSLKESLADLQEAVRLNQCEVKNLERKRRLLQSASFLFEQDRIKLITAIEAFNKIIESFR